MDETEEISYASLKRKNDIDHSETIVYASPKRESEDEIDEKIYKEPKLETTVEIEKQAVEDEKKIIKSELEQNKVDIQIAKKSGIKKVQDVFDEVNEEEPSNVLKISLLMTMIFSTVKRFLMQIVNLLLILLTEQILLLMLKDLWKNQIHQKWKLFILRNEKLRRKNKCQLMTTKREKMGALKIV